MRARVRPSLSSHGVAIRDRRHLVARSVHRPLVLLHVASLPCSPLVSRARVYCCESHGLDWTWIVFPRLLRGVWDYVPILARVELLLEVVMVVIRPPWCLCVDCVRAGVVSSLECGHVYRRPIHIVQCGLWFGFVACRWRVDCGSFACGITAISGTTAGRAVHARIRTFALSLRCSTTRPDDAATCMTIIALSSSHDPYPVGLNSALFASSSACRRQLLGPSIILAKQRRRCHCCRHVSFRSHCILIGHHLGVVLLPYPVPLTGTMRHLW